MFLHEVHPVKPLTYVYNKTKLEINLKQAIKTIIKPKTV